VTAACVLSSCDATAAEVASAADRWPNEGGDRLEHPGRFPSRPTHDVATSTFADASEGHAA
jgi:hypothetical protein